MGQASHPRHAAALAALLAAACLAAPSARAQASAPGDAADAAERVPLAFQGFEAGDIAPSGIGILADTVRHEISISPRYTLVDRSLTGTVLAEWGLQLSGAVDPASVVETGRLLGVRKLVSGRIGILGSLYVISLSMLDLETGTVERQVTEEFLGAIEELRKPVRIAAQKLLGIEGIDVDRGSFIAVQTEPPGVYVVIDGLFEGSSPVKVRVEKPGRHAVKLYAEGWRTWTQNVTVAADSTYFLNATLLRQEKEVDLRIKALQDGRVPLLVFTTAYAAAACDVALFSLGSDNVRLYIGLPLVVSPLAFYGMLNLTADIPVNGGRSFMVTSSALWGSTWGLAASLVYGAVSGGEGPPRELLGLSVGGGLAYGTAAWFMTGGERPFPTARAWYFNLGSALGAMLGLGLPYVLNLDNPWIIYAGMFSGSLAGSGLSLWLSRGVTEGTSVENLALAPRLELGPEGPRAGLVLTARY